LGDIIMGETIADQAPQRPQTLGEQRVRLSFNPNANARVETIKTRCASIIDLCEDMKVGETRSEVIRLLSLAQTHVEDAAMWAVKGATADLP